MGSLKKLHGWYVTGGAWLPIVVDENGKVVLSNIPGHYLSHQYGGGDVISLEGLHVPHHKTSHQDGGDDEIDITGLGTPTRARAYLSATQYDLVSGTWTKVLLDAESYDVGSNFASYKFTAPVDGYYLVTGSVVFINTIAAKDYLSYLYKNGVSIIESHVQSAIFSGLSAQFTDIVYLTAGQYLELYALSLAGVDTVHIIGGASLTHLTVNLLQV